MKKRLLGVLGVIVLLLAASPRAHNLGESYLYLQVYQHQLSGRFEISLEDLNRGFKLTGTGREITAANLDQHADFLKNYYREHVTIPPANVR